MPVTLDEVLNNAEMPPQTQKAIRALMPRVIKVSLSPAAVAANTTAEQTFTVNGLALGDFVAVLKPSTQAGLAVAGARVSAANQVAVAFANVPALVQTSASLTPALVAANTTAEQIFAVAAAAVGDIVVVNKPTAQAGLGIVGARVSSAGNIGITFSNNTAAGITPTAAETYVFGLIRSAAITPTAAETYLVLHAPALLNPQANVIP